MQLVLREALSTTSPDPGEGGGRQGCRLDLYRWDYRAHGLLEQRHSHGDACCSTLFAQREALTVLVALGPERLGKCERVGRHSQPPSGCASCDGG
jgi:hypothetical protein